MSRGTPTDSGTLIFNADDYGCSKRGVAAVNAVLAAGIVKSVTVMANAPLAHEAEAVSRRFPHVSVGVHLNLTEGRPVLPAWRVPTLVARDGRFLPAPALLRRCLLRLVDGEQVFEELTAQVVKVAALVGKPTHLDSHQNVHAYPVVLRAFLAVCEATGITRVRSQRVFCPTLGGVSAPSGAARRFRECFKLHQERRIRRTGLRSPDRSMPYTPGYNADASRVPEMLDWWGAAARQVPPGVTEVFTHPASGRAEAQLYQSSELAGLLEGCGLRVASYASL